MGHTYVTVLMTIIDLTRLLTLTFSSQYRVLARKFFNEFHLFHVKDKSDFAMKIHKQIHYVCHLFALYLLVGMFSSCIFFNLAPLYNNYASGKFKEGGLGNSSYELSLYYVYPFDVTHNQTGYTVSFVINWVLTLLCACWYVSFDLMLSIMVFHVWGHFKILINELGSFPVPKTNYFQTDEISIKNENYSEDDQNLVEKMLKNCIDSHRNIAQFTNELSDVFGPMLFMYFAYFQAVCCVLLLECSQMTPEALVRYFLLTFINFQQLIQVSCIIEMIGTVSEQLPDGVYGLPWEHMNKKNKKTVFIFLMNVQTPIYLKAMGLVNVGVQPMAMILKTSFSYFMFLRSL